MEILKFFLDMKFDIFPPEYKKQRSWLENQKKNRGRLTFSPNFRGPIILAKRHDIIQYHYNFF